MNVSLNTTLPITCCFLKHIWDGSEFEIHDSLMQFNLNLTAQTGIKDSVIR